MTTDSVFQRADVHLAPLRVTLLFQDGSAFSYDETRETVDEIGGDPLGLWKVPMDEDSFGFKLVDYLTETDIMSVLLGNCGQVVAVQSQPREDTSWP